MRKSEEKTSVGFTAKVRLTHSDLIPVTKWFVCSATLSSGIPHNVLWKETSLDANSVLFATNYRNSGHF